MRTAHFIGNARKSAVLLRFIYSKKRCGDNTIKQYFCYFKAIRGAAARRCQVLLDTLLFVTEFQHTCQVLLGKSISVAEFQQTCQVLLDTPTFC